ncbi:MAG: hypothetical protein RIR26_619, partial [Pseudomonadota bacterium]
MINLVLLSACVSLVTLAILFIQRIRPQKLKIPSYFLGESAQKRLLKLQTRPPRWWEWVLVMCITTGVALAYFSKTQPESEGQTQGQGLFWFDPTLSHILALQRSETAQDGLTESLREMNLSEYIFAELTFSNSESAESQFGFNLKKVKPSELREYVARQVRSPSALSQPMDAAQLIAAVKRELSEDPMRLTLTLITDAQSETLRPLSTLTAQFENVKVLRTPRSQDRVAGRRTPVIPQELAEAWTPRTAGENNEQGLPGTPQFVKVEGALAGYVPPQARPSLSLEEFSPDSTELQNLASRTTQLFVGEDPQSESTATGRGQPPLLTTCTLDVAGPSELDGLSDLRAYAQFFKIPIRPLACRTTESAQSAKKADIFDPWKYRRASVWVVPANDFVAGQLFQQGLHWIPEGFAPETDALVYIADTRMQGGDSLLESMSIQLEENQPSLRLPLLPLPPEQLLFPWDLGAQESRSRTRPIATRSPLQNKTPDAKEQDPSRILLKASDGTPLAFSLSAK